QNRPANRVTLKVTKSGSPLFGVFASGIGGRLGLAVRGPGDGRPRNSRGRAAGAGSAAACGRRSSSLDDAAPARFPLARLLPVPSAEPTGRSPGLDRSRAKGAVTKRRADRIDTQRWPSDKPCAPFIHR